MLKTMPAFVFMLLPAGLGTMKNTLPAAGG
jgi:hypothetical protein